MIIFKRGEDDGIRVPFNSDYVGEFKKAFPTKEALIWKKSADTRIAIRYLNDYPAGLIIIEENDNQKI